MFDATKDISSRGSKYNSIFRVIPVLRLYYFQLNFMSESAQNVVKHHGNLREGDILFSRLFSPLYEGLLTAELPTLLSVEEKDLSSKRPLDPVFGRRMWSHNKQTENEDEGSANNSLSFFRKP